MENEMDPHGILKTHIGLVIEGLKHLDVDAAADLIAKVADELAEGGPEDLFHGAILDGLRWGYAAAVQVELAGGAMVRVVLPGGIGMTYEWDDEVDARDQIKAVCAMMTPARTKAQGVGD
jgi:hypothetical protein